MRTIRQLLWLALGALAGCASLSIDVDVYKNSATVDRRELGRAAARVLAEPMFNLDAAQKQQRRELFVYEVSEKVQDYLYPLNAPPARPTDAQNQAVRQLNITSVVRGRLAINQKFSDFGQGALGGQIAAIVDREFFTPIDDLRRTAATLSEAVHRQDVPDSTLQSYNDKFVVQSHRVNAAPERVKQEVTSHLGNSFASGSQLNFELDAKIAAAIDDELTPRSDLASGIASQASISGRLVGYPIFDPGVARLAEDEKNWAPFGRNRFNVTGGNAQFVVVREGSVVFHKKSLDFDPSSAISAGQAAADLALNVAGALATGKMVKSTPSTTGGAPTVSTDNLLDIGQAETARTSLEQREVLLKSLLLRIAELLERAQGGATVAALKADFNRIVHAYQSQAGTGAAP